MNNPFDSPIVRLFYELARTHERVRGFIYAQSRDKGYGNEFHPLVWLDDPILGRSGTNNAYTWTVNFDVLGVPDGYYSEEHIQARADAIALDMIEKIKKTRFEDLKHGFSVGSVADLTLRNYYDNKAAGKRYTIELIGPYAGNRCTDPFDPDKVLPSDSLLPDIDTSNAQGCAIFKEKGDLLPNFDFAKS